MNSTTKHQPCVTKAFTLLFISIGCCIYNVGAFVMPGQTHYCRSTFPLHEVPNSFASQPKSSSTQRSAASKKDIEPWQEIKQGMTHILVASTISMSVLHTNTPAALAYDFDDSNTDVDTVSRVVQSLKDASGNAAASFQVFENINEIITEGKGVGGMINSSGVKLQRGYVADEDTTIYNPGLSLLTESEKETIVNAVIQNRKENIVKKTWNSDNEVAYDFLKTKLDPLHMVELKGYLGILPFYGAGVYLVALAVQQFARDLFAPAYIISAVAVFLPILVLIAKGV